MIKLINVAPVGFTGTIKFSHKNTPFGEIKIKEPLKENISLYVFLFKIMEDSFKDQPELNMGKFGEIFEAGMSISGKEKTEEQIMKMFGEMFTIKFKKNDK